MSPSNQIDNVVKQFWRAFDNRNGRQPDLTLLPMLFVDSAMIYKQQGDALEAMTLDQFISPRASMLTDGTLTDFHEWEIEPETFIDNTIATRISRFGKSGFYNNEPYQGEGRKHIQLVNTDAGWKITSVIWQED